jgi:hypothetical protein
MTTRPCAHRGRDFIVPYDRPKQKQRLFLMNHKGGRVKIYCGTVCREAAHFARHADADNKGEEMPVVEIMEVPRRLAVARMVEQYEDLDTAFNSFEPVRFMNPADKRASR